MRAGPVHRLLLRPLLAKFLEQLTTEYRPQFPVAVTAPKKRQVLGLLLRDFERFLHISAQSVDQQSIERRDLLVLSRFGRCCQCFRRAL